MRRRIDQDKKTFKYYERELKKQEVDWLKLTSQVENLLARVEETEERSLGIAQDMEKMERAQKKQGNSNGYFAKNIESLGVQLATYNSTFDEFRKKLDKFQKHLARARGDIALLHTRTTPKKSSSGAEQPPRIFERLEQVTLKLRHLDDLLGKLEKAFEECRDRVDDVDANVAENLGKLKTYMDKAMTAMDRTIATLTGDVQRPRATIRELK